MSISIASQVVLPEPNNGAEGRANQSNPPRANPSRKPGFLFLDLKYLDEDEAAVALDITTPTLIGYRKRGIGPQHTIVGRRILYNVDKLAEWLADGGVREAPE